MSRRRSAAKKKRNDGRRPPFTWQETGCRTQLGALIAPARGSRTAPMASSALPRQKPGRTYTPTARAARQWLTAPCPGKELAGRAHPRLAQRANG